MRPSTRSRTPENDDGYRVSALEAEPDEVDVDEPAPPSEPEAADSPQSSYRDASKKAAQLAQALAGVVNVAELLASPREWAKATPWPSRAHLIEHLDKLLSAMGPTNGGRDLTAPAGRLRALLSTWEPGPDVPAEISEAARALLSAVGIAEPPGGWDAPEGTPDAPSQSGE